MNSEVLSWIRKKRDGDALSAADIHAFIRGVSNDTIPDYQVASLLMAICLRGMDDQETASLTLAMCDSGEQIDLSQLSGIKVDKHSTGGVGDTTTLVLLPLIAACGVPVIKMSGRGLGFTGGTIDKLESIPGFDTSLSIDQAIAQGKEIGAAILSQSARLCPADQKLYALRDVTGTVESIPLIAASIMSKKIAAGADAIVLDVKCGKGAFMKDLAQARVLAKTMVCVGRAAKRQVTAVITSMDQPLGMHVGNTLEVAEAIAVLSGQKTGDLLDVSLFLGAHMLMLAQVADSLAGGKQLLQKELTSGRALEKLRQIIAAQGGNPAVCDQAKQLPTAPVVSALRANQSGFVASMDTEEIGNAFVRLGGGRLTKDQQIDPTAGLVLACRIGDVVREGDALIWVHGATQALVQNTIVDLRPCIVLSTSKPPAVPMILDTITA